MKNFFLVALIVYILDRITKWWIFRTEGLPFEILPVFRIVKTWNPGIVFGLGGSVFFKAQGLVLLILFVFLSSVLFTAFKSQNKLEKYALGMIFGGGLGNLTDRFLYGKVLDFIDLHLNKFHWPAFNIADTAITVGVLGIILSSLKKKNRK